jgi:NTE family protein
MNSRELPPPVAPPEHDATVPTPREGLERDELPQAAPPSEHAVETYLPREEPRGVALCLSGGGYRATLFHLGALRRLNELGILGKINTITSVSGGSILAGHLAGELRSGWPDPGERIADFDAEVAGPIHRMCQRNIRTLPLLMGLLGMVYPPNWDGHIAVDRLEREYFVHLTKRRIRELPERPRFVFCATDMAYGVNWTFTRDKVGSYMAGYAAPPADWTVARAVAASSCFPPFFNPQPIGLGPGDLEPGDDKSEARPDRIRGLRLSDGGLYDNMGLEPVWKNHAVVLVSEGGSTFDAGGDLGLFWRLNRYVDVMGRQSGAIRRRWLIAGFVKQVLRGTYWGIGTDAANYSKTAPRYDQKLVNEVIAEVRTDLDKFTDPERFVLENHGYLLADAAIARYADFLAIKPVPKAEPPHPEWMDSAKVSQALAESHKRKLPFGR